MKTAEYIKQFKLDKPNYNFNRENLWRHSARNLRTELRP